MLDAKIGGYLNYVVEDTKLTIDDLWVRKTSCNCILAIETLTKKPGQNYWHYIAGVKLDKLVAVAA